MTGVLVLIGTLALACVLGLAMRARSGRVRETAGHEPGPEPGPEPGSGLPGEVRSTLVPGGVTLVQLSTSFCAPCRHTRVLLSDLAERTDGLHHAELDVTDRPDLARELSVLRTPTTLAVDERGTELLRIGGVPRRDALLDALRPHLATA
jgi:thiol-disulfide isomerase/thioredoxin